MENTSKRPEDKLKEAKAKMAQGLISKETDPALPSMPLTPGGILGPKGTTAGGTTAGNTVNAMLGMKKTQVAKPAEIGVMSKARDGSPMMSYSREENKPNPVAPKKVGDSYRRILAEVKNGPSMTEKISRGEWTSGMNDEIGRGVNRSKNLAKGPSMGAVAKEASNIAAGVKNKVVRRAKKLYGDRMQAQKNWENRPDNSNYTGSWTEFKAPKAIPSNQPTRWQSL